jgi:glycosyltransferase WbpL
LSQIRLSGIDQILLTCAVFLLAFGIALVLSHKAHLFGLVDVPNERSSHSRPTPRGGGLAIFIAVTLSVWFCRDSVDGGIVWRNLLIGAGAIAIIGLWDDARSVSPYLRLCVHAIAAVFLVLAFPVEPEFQLAKGVSISGAGAIALSCIGVVSLVNVFNFMDGIDGLAASEAAFVTAGAALLLLLISGHSHAPVALVCLLVSAASAGFLVLNWSPARIFLGDVGSGFLGFAIAAVVLWTLVEHLVSFWVWLILGGLFVADAAVTFFRRLARGENVATAHRMHAYQRLARAWSSHQRVTLLATLINCLWLFPLAIVASVASQYAPLVAVIAVLPIGIAAWICGAGLPD